MCEKHIFRLVFFWNRNAFGDFIYLFIYLFISVMFLPFRVGWEFTGWESAVWGHSLRGVLFNYPLTQIFTKWCSGCLEKWTMPSIYIQGAVYTEE